VSMESTPSSLSLRQPHSSGTSSISDSPISHPSLLPLLVHLSAHPLLPLPLSLSLSFTPALKPTCFTSPTPAPAVSLNSSSQTAFTKTRTIIARTVLIELLSFLVFPSTRLSWSSPQLLSARRPKCRLPCRIVKVTETCRLL